MGRKINVTNNSVLFKNENNVATNALYFSNDGGVEISGTMLCDVSINNAINRVTFQQLTDEVALQENTITSLRSKLETLKSQINYPVPEPEPEPEPEGPYTYKVRILYNNSIYGNRHLIFNGVQISTGTIYNSNSEITLLTPFSAFSKSS